MTEDEAKTKVCFQTLNPIAVKVPDLSWEVRSRNCIASACMAWRWMSELNPDPNPESPLMVFSATEGGCGLAGG